MNSVAILWSSRWTPTIVINEIKRGLKQMAWNKWFNWWIFFTPIYGVMGPYLQLLGARFVHSVFFGSVPVDILGSMLQDLIVYCFSTIVFCVYACFFNSMMWWHSIAFIGCIFLHMFANHWLIWWLICFLCLFSWFFVSVVKSCGKNDGTYLAKKPHHVQSPPRFVEDRTDKIGLLLGRKKT